MPATERFKHCYTWLVALARADVYKDKGHGGMARILCAVDANGKQHEDPCYASDMRELAQGVWVQIPDDVKGGLEWVRIKAYHMLTSCDYLAAQSLTPFVEGATAIFPCRKCDYSKRDPQAGRAFSFWKRPCADASTSKGPRVGFQMRSWPHIRALVKQCISNPAEAPTLFKLHGLNKVIFALDPDYLPHVDPTKIPEDGLHLGPDGVLRHEGAWLFYILFKLGLDINAVNAAIRAYRDWPPDVRIPDLHAGLKKGKRGGQPKNASMLRMSGSQVMHFTFHRCAYSPRLSFLAPLTRALSFQCCSPHAVAVAEDARSSCVAVVVLALQGLSSRVPA